MDAHNELEVAESWEDADTEDLEHRMEVRQKHSLVEERETTLPLSSTSVKSQLPLRVSEWEGAQYVKPVKILRRPMESTVPKHGSVAQPLVLEQQKSLAEREAEYADARARILGSKVTECPILPTPQESAGTQKSK